MKINASIIDQQIIGIINDHPDCLPITTDLSRKKSAAFVLLCISTCLEMTIEEAAKIRST